MSKRFAWSYSALDTYDGDPFGCPKKYYETRVLYRHKEKQSAAAAEGVDAHKAFENYLLKGEQLPLGLRHHTKSLDRLKNFPGTGYPEQKLALNRDMQPTGYFDDDVWLRGIVDYAKHKGTDLVIVDHKFGKVQEGFDQVKLMAAVMMAYMPEVENVKAAYYWAKAKKFASIKLTPDDVPAIWNIFLPRVARLEQALKTTDFPAKPNGLCRRYCPVESCPYHGVGG